MATQVVAHLAVIVIVISAGFMGVSDADSHHQYKYLHPETQLAPETHDHPPSTHAPHDHLLHDHPPETIPLLENKLTSLIYLPPATKPPAETYLPPSAIPSPATKAPAATYTPPATKPPVETYLPPSVTHSPAPKSPPPIYLPPATKPSAETYLPPSATPFPATKAPAATYIPPESKSPPSTYLPPTIDFTSLDPATQDALTYIDATFKLPLNKPEITSPFCYRFGYEIQDVATGSMERHYESRIGDVATGNYTKIEADGSSLHIDYTSDTLGNLTPVIRTDKVQGQSEPLGYASFAAPQAFASHHTPEEYTFKTIPSNDQSNPLCKTSPLIEIAYNIHKIFLQKSKTQQAYKKYSFGTEICNTETGSTRSQYESRDGECGQGNYAVVGNDGSRVSIDYIVSAKGFAVVTPVT